jgi:hypothetical protein
MNKSRTVVTMASTARLGMVSIDGEVERPVTRVSVSRRNSSRGGKKSELVFVQGLYTAPGRVPRHGLGRGEGASAREKSFTASCCPPSERKGMRMISSLIF